jgi:hypothetical protein
MGVREKSEDNRLSKRWRCGVEVDLFVQRYGARERVMSMAGVRKQAVPWGEAGGHLVWAEVPGHLKTMIL